MGRNKKWSVVKNVTTICIVLTLRMLTLTYVNALHTKQNKKKTNNREKTPKMEYEQKNMNQPLLQMDNNHIEG